MYAAQEIPQIDTEIAQKGHFRMETNYECQNRERLRSQSSVDSSMAIL